MNPGEFIGLVAVVFIFSIPLVAIWTEHHRKVLKMQLELRNQGDMGLRGAIDSLREEVRSLRDTTTQYDMSFDSALQRMERRVEGLERRVNEVEPNGVAELRTGR
jgi:hypothetical protein